MIRKRISFILSLLTVSAVFGFQSCGPGFSGSDLDIGAQFNSSALLNSADIKGNLYLEGRRLSGVVCSNDHYVELEVGAGSNKKNIQPALTFTGSDLKKQNRFISKECQNMTHLSFFSANLPNSLKNTKNWKVIGQHSAMSFEPILLNSKGRNYGILYHTWHCPVSEEFDPDHVYDVEKILKGQGDWGPLNWPHWVGKPFDGYYCLKNRPEIIKKHAIQLVNAGIDYIYIDITNWPYAYNDDGGYDQEFKDKIHDPLMKLLQVYRQLQASGIAVPKVVPWIGATNYQKKRDIRYKNSVVKWAREVFHPQSAGVRFHDGSKPFLFYKVANGHYNYPDVKPMIDQLRDKFYPIPKWAQVEHFAKSPQKPFEGLNKRGVWSYLEPCKVDGNHNIVKGCKQRRAGNQASVAPAYQHSHMLHPLAQGKNNGITLYHQFQGAMKNGIRFVSIASWNEWLGRKSCKSIPHSGNAPLFIEHDDISDYFNYRCRQGAEETVTYQGKQYPFFADAFNYNRSRGLEPNRKFSDCYYQLMRHMIHADKMGQGDLSPKEKQSFAKNCGFKNLRSPSSYTPVELPEAKPVKTNPQPKKPTPKKPTPKKPTPKKPTPKKPTPKKPTPKKPTPKKPTPKKPTPKKPTPKKPTPKSPNPAPKKVSYGPVVGSIASVAKLKDGRVRIKGWACQKGVDKSIAVHIYVGNPYRSKNSGDFFGKALTRDRSEKAVHDECKTKGSVTHRFDLIFSEKKRVRFKGKKVYMYGIREKGSVTNSSLNRSGQFRIP